MASVDETPIWIPRSTSSQEPDLMETSPDCGSRNDARKADPLVHYGTYSPTRKPAQDRYMGSSTSPDVYSQGTWPRSASRSSQNHSDLSLPRSTFKPSSPIRGTSLQTIREMDHDPWVVEEVSSQRTLYDAPSLGPTMKNGMSTTVPQNMVQQNLNCSHQPSTGHLSGIGKLSKNRETFEVRCCRITVLLVIMQIFLGIAITALGFYTERLSPSLLLRECPYWAGIPLVMAGIFGLYFCATDFTTYSASMRAFIVKAVCFTISAVCIFMTMVAAVFPGIHGHRIAKYSSCQLNVTELLCRCIHPWHDVYIRDYEYRYIDDCTIVTTSIKDLLILQCALNAIASGVCLWFVMLLWKKRYEDFHSGLRFYSYSASIPPHPWADPNNPPYFKQHEHNSPVTIHKLSKKLNSDRNLEDPT